MQDRVYLCIDLKSFYASVECVERGLDPMTTNLRSFEVHYSTNTPETLVVTGFFMSIF